MKVGVSVCAEPDSIEAGVQAAREAAAVLADAAVDVALVFASGRHLAAPEATLEAVYGVLEPHALVGCGAGGVLGGGRELESGTGVAVWAASLEGGGRGPPLRLAGRGPAWP